MSLDLPYKTTFAAQIRAIEPSVDEMREAKASLTDLKALLPSDINPEDDPQLLYISANLYVAGMVNLNDDGVDIETSLATYKGFEKQQLNIEHDRGRVAGYIIHAGLSEFGTDRLITEDEARAAGRPFNVAVAAVLWKVNNPKLCAFLAEASNPLHPDYKTLSLSFEVGFSSYNIGIVDGATRVISEAARIVRPEDADYQDLNQRLRANGGSGKVKMDSQEIVCQILSGTFLPLGGGIVSAPAAAVRGIVAVTEQNDTPESTPTQPSKDQDVADDEMDAHQAAERARLDAETQAETSRAAIRQMRESMTHLIGIFENKSLSRIISPETRVSPITSITTTPLTMSKALLEQLKQKVASAEKPEDMKLAFAGMIEIAEAITNESVRLQTELDAEKNRGAEIERARTEAAAANDQLKRDLEAVHADLATIRANQAAAEAAAKFDERMATIDSEFDLADDERALIIDDVKGLDDSAFDLWMTKAKKLMKEKSKPFKKLQQDDKKKKQDDMKAALAAKGITVTMDENDLFKEIIASAQANNVSAPIDNLTVTNTKTLAERAREEFEQNTSIGGKKISEYKK